MKANKVFNGGARDQSGARVKSPRVSRRWVFLLLSCLLISTAARPGTVSLAQVPAAPLCRFGIASPGGSQGYDIASIGVGGYLDWGASVDPNLPAGVEYVSVLRVRNDLYPRTLQDLAGRVAANPGGAWLIGNEPDTTYEIQDALTAEVYAQRYWEVAGLIRTLDPSARLGFGTIVQPTPIRMRYLDRAWTKLAVLTGSAAAASALIDFWSIHAFILNEQPRTQKQLGDRRTAGF